VNNKSPDPKQCQRYR